MRTIWRIILVSAMCMMFADGPSAQPEAGSPELTLTDMHLVQSSNQFGLNLFHKVAAGEPADKNVFISPLSISYALAMTLNGADGDTKNAIAKTLEVPSLATDDVNASFMHVTSLLTKLDSAVTFDIANSIWYRSGLPVKKVFIDVNQSSFNARVSALDFASPSAADLINQWVNENTKGKITEIVTPPIDPQTIMFLINAIYFKGCWTVKFDQGKTEDRPFYPTTGGSTTCRMMLDTRQFDYFETDTFQAIRLPYGNRSFSMVVILPRPKVGLDGVIEMVDANTWHQWQGQFHPREVEFGLPRFKFAYDISLKETLRAMGMATAFDPEKANFDKMLEPQDLQGQRAFISDVKHKTFLQVDEEGTEAAAVTAVVMAMTSAAEPSPPPVMIVDRPFLFGIVENKSGSLIFVGKIEKPVWED